MYSNIKPATFLEGPNGPAVHRTHVVIPLEANQREYKLEEKTTLENNYLVGLWVTKPDTVVESGRQIAADAVFDSAYINLRTGTNEVIRKLYLRQILDVNQSGCPYEISIADKINLVESEVKVMNDSNIAADTVLEIQFDYVVSRRR
ncbi:MAG: hypothetical protein AAF741_15635 [Bacteroidota bacterium]